MAKRVALVLGIGFVLVGIIGFFAPEFLGMHLSLTHSVIHLLTGGLSIYFGTGGTLGQAKAFCIIFGIVYGLLGIAGFMLGIDAAATVPGPGGPHMLKVIPGHFEVGTSDHVVHIILGTIYLIAGLTTRTRLAIEEPGM